MTTSLTSGQRAQLEQLLRLRLHELDRRVQAHGGSRPEAARASLEQDGDDAPQRDADREVELALSDLEMRELGAASAALARVHDLGFGLCGDCGAAIPFDRLRVEPWAERCVPCEAAREGAAPRGT